MEKNNDIQVNKVSKWDAAPEDMGTLFTYIDMVIGMACCLPHEIHDNLYDLMDKTLDKYNELEAKYQESCGMISQYEKENRILQEQTNRLEVLCRTLNDNDIIADWSEAALKWNLYKWDEVKNQWCSYDKATTCESCKKHYEEELRIREKEKDDKDKLIDKLTHENVVLKLKNYSNGIYGLTGKIEELKKENKELKDMLAKDREFGKYVGKLVADSIQEGWKNGAYELHPYTRFDIRVEETNNMSTTFDRYSIPNVVVAFNNVQTEMERDTAQHECEELDRKFKELEKENKELKDTLAMCERDANTAKNLCNGMVSKVKRTRNNKEEN